MEPIKINVKDNFKHTQIAFLVDREDFRKDILHLRRKWLGTDEPFASESFEEWFNKLRAHGETRDSLLRKNAKIIQKSSSATEMLKIGKKKEAEKLTRELDMLLRKLPNLDFKGDIETLLIRYHVPSTCFKAIARALVSSEVKEKDWQFYEVLLEPGHLEPEQRAPSRIVQEPRCVITLTPYITKTKVGEVFDSIKDEIKNLYKKSSYGYKNYSNDTITNIERDRKWYWANVKGMSYTDILIKIEKNKGITWGGISQAVRQYKRNLVM